MNPNYNQDGSLNPHNQVNDAEPRTMRNFNTFDMSYPHALTARFADATPFFVFETETQDKVPFQSTHELLSPTLSSVFHDKIRIIKDYFSVPFKAIMPNTWELIYANPTQGDDVPDDANCVINSLLNLVKANNFREFPENFSLPTDFLTTLWRRFRINELFFDDGELLSLLGCKLGKYYQRGNPYNSGSYGNTERVSCWYEDSVIFYNAFKGLIEYILTESTDEVIEILTAPREGLLVFKKDYDANKSLWFRRIVEFLKDHPDAYFSFDDTIALSDLTGLYYTYATSMHGVIQIPDGDLDINISRVVAYQLAVRHFMSNDKVDFIYSAQLFRDMMKSLAYKFLASSEDISSYIFFDYNGSGVQYDIFSGRFVTDLFAYVSNPFNSESSAVDSYPFIFISELFSLQKSLKYGDYFTGARPQPLAVGDVNAPVVNNGVSAIDMTRNIMMQRFLNAVNKTGRKFSDYLRSIRGGKTMPLLTDPKFLARDTAYIGQQEIENTSEDQGKLVSLMRSQSSQYAFEVDVEDPSIILGIVSFDVVRSYSRTIDRQFFIKDRFDMFNPYMQNIGDQEIYEAEKNAGGADETSAPFAYTLRHMEYKQRFPIVSGGFAKVLPSYTFVADSKESEDFMYNNIGPEFIRSHNTELDRYYSSLTGFTPTDYYHFMIWFNNISNVNRNMEYSPTIL